MTDEARRHFVKTRFTALVAAGIADGAEVEQDTVQTAQSTIEEHQIRPLSFFWTNVEWDVVAQRMGAG